jgi:hypothetical protein
MSYLDLSGDSRPFGETAVFHLACVDQLFHRSGDIFNRNTRINAMLVEEIHRFDAQQLWRSSTLRSGGGALHAA